MFKLREVWALPANARRYYLRRRRCGQSHEIVMCEIARIHERIRDDRGVINLRW